MGIKPEKNLDKLDKKNYGSYVLTFLGGKALQAVEHVDPSVYQKDC